MDKEYYVVKKNMQGVYLLDTRNNLYYAGKDSQMAWSIYKGALSHKKDKEVYTIFTKTASDKFLTVLNEKI